MNELNDIEKKEIRIKQDRLKALIDIQKITENKSLNSSEKIDKQNILKYIINEKNELLLDIINSLNIDKFDSTFLDSDNSFVKCTIEDNVNHALEHKSENKILNEMFNEFVNILSIYDITDLIDYEVIENYLKMIHTSIGCYDDMSLEDCEKNT